MGSPEHPAAPRDILDVVPLQCSRVAKGLPAGFEPGATLQRRPCCVSGKGWLPPLVPESTLSHSPPSWGTPILDLTCWNIFLQRHDPTFLRICASLFCELLARSWRRRDDAAKSNGRRKENEQNCVWKRCCYKARLSAALGLFPVTWYPSPANYRSLLYGERGEVWDTSPSDHF